MLRATGCRTKWNWILNMILIIFRILILIYFVICLVKKFKIKALLPMSSRVFQTKSPVCSLQSRLSSWATRPTRWGRSPATWSWSARWRGRRRPPCAGWRTARTSCPATTSGSWWGFYSESWYSILSTTYVFFFVFVFCLRVLVCVWGEGVFGHFFFSIIFR